MLTLAKNEANALTSTREHAAGGQEDAGNESVGEGNRAGEVLVNISDVLLFKDDEPSLSTPE